jgi:hypothetical protein
VCAVSNILQLELVGLVGSIGIQSLALCCNACNKNSEI